MIQPLLEWPGASRLRAVGNLEACWPRHLQGVLVVIGRRPDLTDLEEFDGVIPLEVLL